MLYQHEEVHCIPRRKERLLFVRKKTLELSDNLILSLHYKGMFKTQGSDWAITGKGDRSPTNTPCKIPLWMEWLAHSAVRLVVMASVVHGGCIVEFKFKCVMCLFMEGMEVR